MEEVTDCLLSFTLLNYVSFPGISCWLESLAEAPEGGFMASGASKSRPAPRVDFYRHTWGQYGRAIQAYLNQAQTRLGWGFCRGLRLN